MRLNLQSLRPNFVIIDTAGEHDCKRAPELCAGIKSGEIVLFDKGYVANWGHGFTRRFTILRAVL